VTLDKRQWRVAVTHIARNSGAALETFFTSEGLGHAYRRRREGASKEQRINDALVAAAQSDRGDEVLRSALEWFDVELPTDKSKPPLLRQGREFVLDGTVTARSHGPSALKDLHPTVRDACATLFENGHTVQAIFEAFKRVELEARSRAPASLRDRPARDLMASLLDQKDPAIRLNRGRTQSDRDEQEGFKLIFMGAMQGIRNPKAHDAMPDLPPERALEYLSMASLLMRRLDEGTTRRRRGGRAHPARTNAAPGRGN
jgi:uncharacterized protein (TIGR02391 family)